MSGSVRRFVEVPAPLEARVGESLVARVGELLTFGVAVHEQLNHTVHDEALRERTSRSIVDALSPGSAAFALVVLCVLVFCVQKCAILYETRRLLREYGTPVEAPNAPRQKLK